MSGGNGAPYREPCGGWPPQRVRGCARQFKTGEAHIPAFRNATRVPNYAGSGSIPPYARGTAGFCVAPQPCSPWPEPVPVNVFVPTPGEYENWARCEQAGFKVIYAMKAWHGRFGFGDDEICFNGQDASQCPDPAKLSPRSTKYLGRTMSGFKIVKQTDADGVTTLDERWDWQRSYAVGRSTGKVSLSGGVQTHHRHTPAQFDDEGVLQVEESTTDDTATDDVLLGLLTADYGCGRFRGTIADGLLNPTLEELTAETAGSGILYERTISREATHISITFRRHSETPGQNNFDEHYSVNISLGGPYTSADVNQDIKNLLAAWNLANDTVCPWRTDTNCTRGPLVTYYEGPPNTPDQLTAVDFVDTSPYTGEMLGGPTPAGYEKFFNFRQPFINSDGVLSATGQAAPDWAVHATQWTDDHLAALLPPGAFVAFGLVPGCLIAAKYAEVLLPKPSHNYGRPWGRDRFAMEQFTAGCVASAGGGTVTLSDAGSIASGSVCGLAGTDVDGVYAVTKTGPNTYALGGKIRDIPTSLMTGGGAVLGKLRWPTAPAIAGRVAVVDASRTTPIVITLGAEAAKQAFQVTGDTVAVSGVKGNTAANGTWGITSLGDNRFSLNGSAGNGAYAGGGFASSPGAPGYQWQDNGRKGDWTLLTWTSNYRDVGERGRLHQMYLDRDSINAGRESGGFPDCDIADPPVLRPITGGWSGVTMGQHCSVFSPCAAAMVAISPNGERSVNGQTFGMPVLACDDIYGSMWQCAPKQWMDDPLWQAPHRPCGSDGGWSNDQGFCQESGGDGNDFYPMAPQEECRTAVPGGAPGMRAGIYLGCLTVGQINAGVTAGNVIGPPGPGSCFATPGTTYLFQEDCVNHGGRFACIYGDPEALCEGEEEFNY